MKWYEYLIFVLLMIILSPVILFGLIIFLIIYPFNNFAKRKSYKKSAYYRDFKTPYSREIFNSNQYAFYNYSVEENLPIKYIKQKTKPLDYFVYNNQIYIFPDFEKIIFDENNNIWNVVYGKNKRESKCTIEEFLNKQMMLFEEPINMPVRILLARDYIENKIIDISKLPESLYIIRNYTSALDNKNIETLSIIPSTTKDLYKMMLANKDLGGDYKLVNEEVIEWIFNKVIYYIAIDDNDGYFEVCKNNKLKFQITHWHPDEYEIYDEICKIGVRGNVLVIKSFLGMSYIAYMGPKEKCIIKGKRKGLYKIYYFESK